MSKASEWADESPESYETKDNLSAFVDHNGECHISVDDEIVNQYENRLHFQLSEDEAVRLGRWLIATFGETPA